MTLRIKDHTDLIHFEDDLIKFIEAYRLEYGTIPKGDVEVYSTANMESGWDYKNDEGALVIFNNEKSES